MKKLRNRLATLLIMGGLSFSSCDAKNHHPLTPYDDNVFCVRKIAVVNTPHGQELVKVASGTTFIIKSGINTYFVTNKHVIEPKVALEEGESIEKIVYDVCDNINDMNFSDDYIVRVVNVDDKSDTAILCYDSRVYKPQPSRNKDPHISETVYVMGLPISEFVVLDEGKFVVEGTRDTMLGEVYVSSTDCVPGMSGGPAYTIRMEKDTRVPELVGYVVGSNNQGTYTLLIPIKYADDCLDEYLKDGKKARKNVEDLVQEEYRFMMK